MSADKPQPRPDKASLELNAARLAALSARQDMAREEGGAEEPTHEEITDVARKVLVQLIRVNKDRPGSDTGGDLSRIAGAQPNRITNHG